MTTVRIARAESRFPPGPLPTYAHTHAVVLADDAGRRELAIWLFADDGLRLSRLLDRTAADPAGQEGAGTAEARSVDELTGRMLRAAGTGVTGVDIDDLGPGVTAARIGLSGPGGARHITARVADGLAVAIAAGAPVRVAGAALDRLAVPARGDGPAPLPGPARAPASSAAAARRSGRPRYEPRNLAFADGLDGWLFGGSFTDHPSESHWHDYACTAEHRSAVLSAAVPEPAGFAFLGQKIFADDYRGAPVVFRGEFRAADGPDGAGLFLRINDSPIRGSQTEEAVLADPGIRLVTVAGGGGWTSHEVTARVPDDSDALMFGIFLTARGRIELRNTELIRST